MGLDFSGGGGGAGSTSLTVQEEGTAVGAAQSTLNFIGAGATATLGSGKYNITIPGGGTGAAWQLGYYTIYFDGTNYHARNERTASEDVTASNTSLHNVFNAAAANLGTGHNQNNCGGLIAFSTPTNHVMQTTSPCLVTDQVTVLGPGRGCVIQAAGSSWTGGNHVDPKAVFQGLYDNSASPSATIHSTNTMARVKLEGLAIDCNQLPGTTGIWFERHGQGFTGGNFSHSYINFCEVLDPAVDGIAVTGGGTSTLWMTGNNVMHSSGYAPNTCRAYNITSADVHLGPMNNAKINANQGWCVYAAGNSIAITGESHMANNGNNTAFNLATGVGPGLIGLFGADHCRISEIYFDNLDRAPGVWVNPGGASGQSSRSQIANCFMHCDPSVTNDLSMVVIDNSGGPAYGIIVQGNSANQDQTLAGSMLKSQVHIINGTSGGNRVQDSLLYYGNTSRKTNGFVTADFGPQSFVTGFSTGPNAAATEVGAGMNIIDNNVDTGSGAGAAANIFKGP